ncbi:MAG: hypothetical protein ACFFDD_09000 [Promethearchaeota archaeon]
MSDEQLLFVRESSGLVKEVGTAFALILPIALTCGGYFHFILPQLSTWFPGALLVPTFAVGSFVILFEGVGLTCLMLAMPRSGAAYHFTGRGLNPIFGSMEGWRSVISNPIFRGSGIFFAVKITAGGIVVIGNAINNAGIIAAGTALQTDIVWLVAVSFVVIIIGFIPAYVRVKQWGQFTIVLGLFSLIALLIADIVLIATPMTSAVWDGVFGAGQYALTQSDAATIMAGMGTTIADYTTMTIAGISAGLSTAVGIMWPYLVMTVAGEVSQPSKNIPISNIGGALGIGGFFLLSAFALETSMGGFLNESILAGYLGTAANATIIYPGVGNYAAVALGANPLSWVVISMPLVTITLDGPANATWVTRPFHAMAMDRMGPEVMAHIHPKYHVPDYALYFSTIIQFAIVILALWYDVSLAIGIAFTYTFVRLQFSWAEVALPYYRPTLWERSGAWKFLGIPVVSIMGLVTGAFFLWATVSFVPSATVPFETFFTVFIFAVGQLFYVYYGMKNSKKGIEMAAIFGQLPPE